MGRSVEGALEAVVTTIFGLGAVLMLGAFAACGTDTFVEGADLALVIAMFEGLINIKARFQLVSSELKVSRLGRTQKALCM